MSQQNWPKEADDKYERINLLGRGAFGGVYSAKTKDTSGDTNAGEMVAIKFIGIATPKAKAYAEREIDILKEIAHPNCIKLIETFEPAEDDTMQVLVLSLAEGPTLERLLQTGGALGESCALIMSRDFIYAIAYLHSRGVLHRDLKPDNCSVVGAQLDDDDIWSDSVTLEDARQKWKLVLLDFGFARALNSYELEDDLGHAQDRAGTAMLDESKANGPNYEKSLDDAVDTSTSKGNSSKGYLSQSISKTISKKVLLDMSAIGTRSYTAPEVFKSLRKTKNNSGRFSKNEIEGTHRRPRPLTDNVADYGMVADAFSVGCTLRYIYTGVPPEENVDEFIAMNSNLLFKLMSMCCSKGDNREKRYRKNSQIPKEMAILIRGLTSWDKFNRTTVRAALYYPLIMGNDNQFSDIPKHDVTFLATSSTTNNNCNQPKNPIVSTEEDI